MEPGKGSGRTRHRHPIAKVKGGWSDHEDQLLCRLVKKLGEGNWSPIARALNEATGKNESNGRIGKQCRERYNHHLRPDIRKEPWSHEEEQALVNAHMRLGNRWSDIARCLEGRSENAVKNFWNATLRKRATESNPPGPLKLYLDTLNLTVTPRRRPSKRKRTSSNARGASPGASSYHPDPSPSQDATAPGSELATSLVLAGGLPAPEDSSHACHTVPTGTGVGADRCDGHAEGEYGCGSTAAGPQQLLGAPPGPRRTSPRAAAKASLQRMRHVLAVERCAGGAAGDDDTVSTDVDSINMHDEEADEMDDDGDGVNEVARQVAALGGCCGSDYEEDIALSSLCCSDSSSDSDSDCNEATGAPTDAQGQQQQQQGVAGPCWRFGHVGSSEANTAKPSEVEAGSSQQGPPPAKRLKRVSSGYSYSSIAGNDHATDAAAGPAGSSMLAAVPAAPAGTSAVAAATASNTTPCNSSGAGGVCSVVGAAAAISNASASAPVLGMPCGIASSSGHAGSIVWGVPVDTAMLTLGTAAQQAQAQVHQHQQQFGISLPGYMAPQFYADALTSYSMPFPRCSSMPQLQAAAMLSQAHMQAQVHMQASATTSAAGGGHMVRSASVASLSSAPCPPASWQQQHQHHQHQMLMMMHNMLPGQHGPQMHPAPVQGSVQAVLPTVDDDGCSAAAATVALLPSSPGCSWAMRDRAAGTCATSLPGACWEKLAWDLPFGNATADRMTADGDDACKVGIGSSTISAGSGSGSACVEDACDDPEGLLLLACSPSLDDMTCVEQCGLKHVASGSALFTDAAPCIAPGSHRQQRKAGSSTADAGRGDSMQGMSGCMFEDDNFLVDTFFGDHDPHQQGAETIPARQQSTKAQASPRMEEGHNTAGGGCDAVTAAAAAAGTIAPSPAPLLPLGSLPSDPFDDLLHEAVGLRCWTPDFLAG